MATFLLIPGMGCGAWLWQPVIRELGAHGQEARAITLPGLGFDEEQHNPALDDAVHYLVSTVREIAADGGAPVVLVAHSGSGIAATGAALLLGRKFVGEMVYYAAVVPEPGRSMAAEFGAPPVDTPPARMPLTRDAVTITLMPDAAPPVQQLVFQLMTTTPSRYFYDTPAFGPVSDLTMPTRYLLGTEDVAFTDTSARFAHRLRRDPEPVPGAHLGMITHPAALAEALMRTEENL